MLALGVKAHIRYHMIVFLEYFPETNCFKCAQANTSGGTNLNTVFYIPGGIIGIEPIYDFKEFDNLSYNGTVNMWADLWIEDVGYSLVKGNEYNETGEYLCFPVNKCLKTHAINKAVNFEGTPRRIYAEKIYASSQPGDAMIGESMSGKSIKGRIIMLYAKAPGMKPKFYAEFTPEILTNKFSKFYIVLEIDDCYWVNLPVGIIGIKPKRAS